MTTNKEVYEGKILETLIKNSERLAVVENKIEQLDTKIEQLDTKIDDRFERLDAKIDDRFERLDAKLNWLFGAVFAVGAGILATLYVQPILNALG